VCLRRAPMVQGDSETEEERVMSEEEEDGARIL
jgi:hypothetical protein